MGEKSLDNGFYTYMNDLGVVKPFMVLLSRLTPSFLKRTHSLSCPSELMRLELKAVPREVVLTFLHEWGEHRVANGSTEIGIPHGPMPVSVELLGNKGDMGLKLIFLASPTDTLKVLPFSLRDGMSSAVVLCRGDSQGAAISGHLGPQMFSLIRSAECDIRTKLCLDAEEIAKRYNLLQRAQKGVNTLIPDHQLSLQDSEPPEHSPIFMGGEMRDILSAYPGGKEELESSLKDSLRDTLNIKELEEHLDFRIPDEKEVKGKNESGLKQQARGFHRVVEEFRTKEGKDEFDHVLNAGKSNAKRQSDALKKQQPQAVALEDGLAQLEVALSPELQGGLDIFAGPPKSSFVGDEAPQQQQVRDFSSSRPGGPSSSSHEGCCTYVMCDGEDKPLLELTEQEFLALDQEKLQDFVASLSVLINELARSPKEMWSAVLREYNDVLLHEYFVLCMRARLPHLRSESERAVLQAIHSRAMVLVQELALVKQQDEIAQLEKIRDICVAALEDMSSLSNKVRAMKPLLDRSFMAYLIYAINRERSMLKDPVNSPSLWLKVLQVIQRGTVAELSHDIRNQVEDISYVLRMEEPEERRDLLKMLIDTMPALDVRKFREVGRNIVAGITSAPPVPIDGGTAKAAFKKGDDGDGLSCPPGFPQVMTPNLRERIVEFGDMLEEYLTDERVEKLSREADEWAAQSMVDASSLRNRAEREVLEANSRHISLERIPGTPLHTTAFLPGSDYKSNNVKSGQDFNSSELLFEEPGEIIDAKGVIDSEEDNEWGEFHDGDFQPVDFVTSTSGNFPCATTVKDSCSTSETSSCPSSSVEEVADDWKGVYAAVAKFNSNSN